MKKIQINASKALLLLILGGTLFSCEKSTKEPPSNRQTFVKILGGGTPANVVKNPIDFLPIPVQILAVDLRRDPNDEAGLFTTMNVIVKDDTAAVKAADPTYLHLPSAWYTIQSEAPKVGGQGGTFSFVFKPSEFAKQIFITVPNATLLNPSAKYALGFTIISVDADGQISSSKSIIIEIGAKNQYDGRYRLDGKFYHPTQSPAYAPFTVNVELHTTGPNTVKLYVPLFGGYYSPGLFGGVLNAFSLQEPAITVNPSTNGVTVQNVASGAVTFYTMAVGYNSRYDVGTKTIYAKWGYSYAVPGVYDAGCREWEDVFTYLGPR